MEAPLVLPSAVQPPSGEQPLLVIQAGRAQGSEEEHFEGIVPAAVAERENSRSKAPSQADSVSTDDSEEDLSLPREDAKPARQKAPLLTSRRPACRCRLLNGCCERAAVACRAVNKSGKFQLVMFLALAFALFLPDTWILINRPDNSDLDVILTGVWVMFLFELAVQLVGTFRTYFNSFFFWTDILGAASVLLDLSYVTDSILNLNSSTVSQNTVVMRAARVAKLGTRAGRFTKLVKLLRFLPGMRELGDNQGTARIISGRLNFALSMRISCLIIVLVMVLPLFSMWTYPEQDWSMKSFMDVLNFAANAGNASSRFAWQLEEFAAFYNDKTYYPFRLTAKSASLPQQTLTLLPWESPRGPPTRMSNALVFSNGDHLQCEFNFEYPNQIDALLSIILLVAVMTLMVGFSLLLSSSVSAIVLRPLERLLMQVRDMAATIFQTAQEIGEEHGSESEGEQDQPVGGDTANVLGTEVELLERVVLKLGAISNIQVSKGPDERDNLAGVDDFNMVVISAFQGGPSYYIAGHGHGRSLTAADKQEGRSNSLSDIGEEEGQGQEQATAPEEEEATRLAILAHTGLSMELLESWNLNPLELDTPRNQAAMRYFLGVQNHGIAQDSVVMAAFLKEMEAGYTRTRPFHNWFHAIDVTHGVYRLLNLFQARLYMSGVDRFGLLVSAVAHDIGHEGLNNSFLVETSHELALQYNDKSPLENMHASRLFEIAAAPHCNIFAGLTSTQFKSLRRVSIDAILHTDNAVHFTMIKEVQMTYEVNSEILDMEKQSYCNDEASFPTRGCVDCYRQPETRRLISRLVLRLADVSNAAKPFRIARIWAVQALEEFFSQGDKERSLGIPVQALNDRGKVNRAYSQIGFIEFLVSPIFFAAVKMLPPIDALLRHLVQNAKSWHTQWLECAASTPSTPAPGDAEKRALENRIAKLETKLKDCL